jgi:fumarate reductase flavoprotein subunit
MTYVIGPKCIACHNCALECPVSAIHFVHTKYEIDPEKCNECGLCEDLCNISAITNTSAPKVVPQPHELRKLSADVVVLGAGASGLVAAVRAAENSGKKVIVLEKAKKVGGNAWYASGFMVLGSRWQQEAGEPDVREDIVHNYVDRFEGKLNPHLIKNAVYATGEFFDWLESKDPAEVKECFSLGQSAPFFFSKIRSRSPQWSARRFYNMKCRDDAIGPGKGGSYVIRRMLQECEKLGIEILTEHRAVTILTDDGGNFSGVLADDPGGQTQVNAKVGIMSTGGWTHNDEMIKKHWPWFFTEGESEPVHRFAIPTVTGDVVGLGESANALVDYDNFWLNMFGPVHHPFAWTFLRFGMEPENVCVNMDGKRFFDESHIYSASSVIGDQPGRIVYQVLDSALVDEIGQRLISNPALLRNKWIIEGYRQDLEEEIAMGTPIKRADTLEDLARQCGIDPATFAATIKRYNEFCARGIDEDHHKDPKALRPIVKAPFYAFFNKVATDGAFGGVLVDEKMRALDKAKKPIPGLFATGDNSSGWGIKVNKPGDHRQFILSELTWAITSGYIAGASAAEYLKSWG